MRHGIDPRAIELEVTEGVAVHDVGAVARRLGRTRDAGVRIAIDDFGTGYSSLAWLQDLPLDTLKIDRAFVARLGEAGPDPSLVNAIQLLASGLGLETVAEGVETEAELARVRALACDFVQGWVHAPAVAPEALAATVAAIEERTGAAGRSPWRRAA